MKQESGRSMVEMLGVLAIMGIITVGAVSMISRAMRTQKLSTVTDDIVSIVTGVRGLLGEYDDFSKLNSETVFSAINQSQTNPYGGKYELSVDVNNPRQFVVSITGLNKSDCENLLTKAWTDSVGYISSDRKQSGATGNCKDGNTNTVSIIYGE